MKKNLLIIAFLFCSKILTAQKQNPENLYPAEVKQGLASYIDKKGTVVFTLDSIETKMVGMSKDYYNGYLTYNNFAKNAITIVDNKGKVVKDIKGLRAVDPFSSPFRDGVAVVADIKNYNLRGVIDFEGNVLIAPSYDNKDLLYAGEGLFVRHFRGKMDVLDKTGNVVFSKPEADAEGNTFNFRFYNGLARFGTQVTKSSGGSYYAQKHGLIDTKGNVVLSPDFQYVQQFHEDKVLVGQSSPELYWFVDKTGKDVFNKKFKATTLGNYDLPRFSEGLANVKDLQTKKAGYIDSQGNWAITPIYENTSVFSNGLGWGIKEDQLSQIFDKTGKVILEGYWGQGGVWWDKNIIYVNYLGSYFDHSGNLLWEKKVPFMSVSSIKQLEMIKNPELVDRVFLSSDNWTILPEKLWKCKNLTFLYLSQYDNVTTLPANIYNFPKLKDLQISISKLEKLPNGIGKLKNLEFLTIRSSKLAKLPIDFGSLSKLQRADLSSNMLTELPKGMERLINLQDLNLDFNPIKTLPEGIFHLPKLANFNFKKNFFINDENTIARLSEVYPKAALTTRVATKPKIQKKEEKIETENYLYQGLQKLYTMKFEGNFEEELILATNNILLDKEYYLDSLDDNKLFQNLVNLSLALNPSVPAKTKTDALAELKINKDLTYKSMALIKNVAKKMSAEYNTEIKKLKAEKKVLAKKLGFEEEEKVDESKPATFEEAFDGAVMMEVEAPKVLAPESEKIASAPIESKQIVNAKAEEVSKEEEKAFVPDEHYKDITAYYKSEMTVNRSTMKGNIAKTILHSNDDLFEVIKGIEIDKKKMLSYLYANLNKVENKKLEAKIKEALEKKADELVLKIYNK